MMLDVSRRQCVIVGGGRVAARKARGLLAAGAQNVRVVSPVFADDIPPGVQRIAEAYEPRHLSGASLVFAATDSTQVNQAVVRDAQSLGALACRADADDETPGDFTTPALHREGLIFVAVSAAGSPALAAAVRDELAQHLDLRWKRLAQTVLNWRPVLRDRSSLPPARRRALMGELAGRDALALLDSGGPQALWRWIAQRYPELKNLPCPPTDG